MRETYEYGTSPLRGKREKHVENLRKQVLLMAGKEDENIASFCWNFLLNEKCGRQVVLNRVYLPARVYLIFGY